MQWVIVYRILVIVTSKICYTVSIFYMEGMCMDLYTVYVAGIMLACPAVSILIESLVRKESPRDWVPFLSKWFIFWAIGCRSLTAGVSQAFNPAFTASMLQADTGAYFIIQELGVANIAIGAGGIVSLFASGWRPAAAATGGIFLGTAGILHILRIGQGLYLDEIVAMIGDLWVLVTAAAFLLYTLRRSRQTQTS